MLTESEKVAIEPELGRPEVVMVRVRERRVRQEPGPKCRKNVAIECQRPEPEVARPMTSADDN